jgi:SAM-dependent methyltransferase
MTGYIKGRDKDSAADMPRKGFSDIDLMARALAIYLPDIGLSLHRAFEARHVLQEDIKSPVLDLGCNDGLFDLLWRGFYPEAVHITGCDMNRADLDRAIETRTIDKAIVTDGRSLPLEDSCMKTVIANSVLTHVPEVDRLLEEVSRVLRPGGKFLFSIPGPVFENQLAWVRIFRKLGFQGLAARTGDGYHLRWHQWHRDGESVWVRRLGRQGLSLIKTSQYPGLRAGFVWSLTFSLIRAGISKFRILNILRTIGCFQVRSSNQLQLRRGKLAERLAPLLAEPGAEGGSIFFVFRKDTQCSQPSGRIEIKSLRAGEKNLKPNTASALRWLSNSKIRIRDEMRAMTGGYGNLIDADTGISPMLYCEITGYAVQFWLRQEKEFFSLAADAGNCLLRAQAPLDKEKISGGFPFGLQRPEGKAVPAYFSFDAGICASALVDLYVKTGDARFIGGAEKAGEFLLSMQTDEGSFKAVYNMEPGHPGMPQFEGWYNDFCALHGKNAIALVKLWRITGEDRWRKAAKKTLDWVGGLQGLRGEFPYFKESAYSMTHTHCYATEGLFFGGIVLDEERYLTSGLRGAEWLRLAQRRNGAFHKDYLTGNSGFPEPAVWNRLHVGPVAQAARIWWIAAQVSPGRPWAESAGRALEFLSRLQADDKKTPVAGAFPQYARALGPWLHHTKCYSTWEAFFACEAVRLWNECLDDPAWCIF